MWVILGHYLTVSKWRPEAIGGYKTRIYSTKVMPFGLKNAGATYQRAMTNIFKELLHHEVECYVDDLVLQLE